MKTPNFKTLYGKHFKILGKDGKTWYRYTIMGINAYNYNMWVIQQAESGGALSDVYISYKDFAEGLRKGNIRLCSRPGNMRGQQLELV